MTDQRVAGHVLLVEDDPSFAGIVARHLRARGYEATVAPTEEAAAAALDAGYRPSIVLLDINLPGESGWSLLRSGRLAAAGSPPVFIVSATVVPPARLREFGVAGYLPKPFALDTLLATVERSTHPEGERGEV
jgi:two-component system, OmpR family, KDP operon response regulator KdpE